jgi:serine/threonine-protein kinase
MPPGGPKNEVDIGDILVDKYRVDRVIGTGGMGIVVQATHLKLKDTVAVKFLRFPGMADDETIARFLREAQAAARIKSPHVARVVDVGTLDSGSPYLVMEFLDGSDLGRIVEADGPFPIELAVALTLQTCEALAAAHASGIIHRDIKPSNLFLTRGTAGEPVVKVLDFGISKVTDPSASSGDLTLTQRSMGSPLYMSPEQMRSARKVDARTDVWSLGAVLYELLTASLPFVADTIPELYALVLDKDSRPPSMRQRREDVPAELDEIVLRCLRKPVEERYQNIAELAADLAPFGGPGGEASAARTRRILEGAGLVVAGAVRIPSTAPRPKSASLPPDASSTETSFGRTGRHANASRRRAIVFAGAALALAVGTVIAVSAIRGSGVAPVPIASTEPAASPLPAMPSASPTPSVVAPAVASSAPTAPPASASSRASVKPARPTSSAGKGGATPDSVLLNRK